MPDYLYLDIETIPASDPKIIAEIAAKVTHPANIKKAESIAEWEKNKKPQAVKDAVAKTSFNGAFGQICCIGFSWNGDETKAYSQAPNGHSEHRMLSKFASIGRPSYEQAVIVGHNVANFDIRFIWQRAFVLGVTLPAWFPRDPKPWSNEVNDTMVMWAGARDTISMDNLAKALGMEGKGDVSGADVAGMWERKEYLKIAEYCKDDVNKTRKIHQKMLISIGEIA